MSAARNERLYVQMVLTALARGHAPSIAVTAGEPLPDPATLTRDAGDLEWFASIGLDLAAQSSEKVVNLLLEAAGIRRFHLNRTEGVVRAALPSHDAGTETEVDFTLKKRTVGGRVQIEIAAAPAA
ncbi:MAG TPA: hypothetical protein VHL80_03085 [Polyangia bacterium]|nr:hypothetical protein [Polyangia bacterium]